MGISVFQLIVVALLITAAVVFHRRNLASSNIVREQVTFSTRLFHWTVMSLAAVSYTYLLYYVYYEIEFEIDGPTLFVNSLLAITAYEFVRHFEKTYTGLIAYFITVPAVAALDYYLGPYLFLNIYNPSDFLGNFSDFINYINLRPWQEFMLHQNKLINAAILAGVASILLRFQTLGTTSTTVNQYTTATYYGGLTMNDKQNEANRYAMSYALLGGSSFRRDIIDRAKDRHNAAAIELGLDFEALLKCCLYFEQRENKFRAVFVFLVMFLIAGGVQESEALVTLSVLAMVVFQIVKSYQDRFKYVRAFRKSNFSAEDFVKQHKVPFDSKDYAGIVETGENNVSIYKGYVPFEAAGLEMGGWSFSVDLSRSKNTLGVNNKPDSFGISDIYGALESAILKLRIPNLVIEDHFFVNGADIATFSDLLPDQFAKPCQIFDDELKVAFQAKTDGLIRHYKWVTIKDWGNDLINSFFVRYEMRGDNLFLEASKYLLTPIDTTYRKLDRVLPYTFMNNMMWLAGSIVKTIFTAIESLAYSYINIMGAIAETFGFQERAKKKLIRNSFHYNYGAPVSLRKKISSPNFMHYYQSMDNDMYLKTLERQIIDATVDFLEVHNIDVSEIKERGSTILNSGVFVQGGDVKAQTLAVGKGAKAQTKGLLSKVRKSPATA